MHEKLERALITITMLFLAVFSPFVLLHEGIHALFCVLTGNQFGGFTFKNFPLSIGAYCRIRESILDRFIISMSPFFIILPIGLSLFLFKSFIARAFGFLAIMASLPSSADISVIGAPAGISVLSYGLMLGTLLAFIIYNYLYLVKGWF
jgi:hypothetical protein